VINGDVSHNDVQVMAQVFFHHLPFAVVDEMPENGLCLLVEKDAAGMITARLYDAGLLLCEFFAPPPKADEKEVLPVAVAIYSVLAEFTGYRPPWGLLTGIRPAKLFTQAYSLGRGRNEAIDEIMTRYLVEESRANLCADVAATQGRIMATSPENALSIYVGVAFCPTICNYCSFSAYPITKFGKRENAYIEALIKEVEHLAKISKDMFVENIYIGGGTPTSLNDENFERLLGTIAENFDTQKALEYTVEAGRPDTITPAKLRIMREKHVGRISINPQTLNDETLQRIGRNHSVADFFEAYKLALEHGFEHINVDLILGLEGEGRADVERSLTGIVALEPKSVTIHSLAVKRASKLHADVVTSGAYGVAAQADMLQLCAEYMGQAGLAPYYLYRQKNSPGNFENVGYAKIGHEGRYNIHMMEETRSVYAAGCGAITKLVDAESGRIERVVNLRDLDQYIARGGRLWEVQ